MNLGSAGAVMSPQTGSSPAMSPNTAMSPIGGGLGFGSMGAFGAPQQQPQQQKPQQASEDLLGLF